MKVKMKLKRVIIIILIFISGCFIQSCKTEHSGDLVLFDFENDADLDRLNWKCHSLFSISYEYFSEGLKSLKIELYPSDYPGVSFKNYERNWMMYQGFYFEVYNPNEEKIRLVLRIDDTSNNISYADRYNQRFEILPGENKIRIPLTDLKTSGGKRNLDLRRIEKLILFVVRPEKKIQLYFDNIRLEKYLKVIKK